jgi:hypothetical protein
MIDHGVAQHAVEPRHGTFFIPDIPAVLESLHKRGLQDIFGHGPRFDASLQKCEELAVAVHQSPDRFGGKRS